MENKSRDNIFSRLKSGAEIALPESEAPWFPDNRDHSPAEIVDEFASRMEATGTRVERCPVDGVVPALLGILDDYDIGNLVRAPETWIGREIARNWDKGAPALLTWDNDDPNVKDKLFASAQASVTTVKAGVADEAAIILWPDKIEPRLLSLVPPVHVAVVKTSQIYSSFSSAMAAFDWAKARPRNAVLISGPSKSADIENTLRIGIHGPVKLCVLIADDTSERTAG